MEQYALYLRKSRADMDAEARGEGETLSKHRKALTAFARRRGLIIVREYAEIVSGDTIAARPQMQQLLEDVKAGMYAGVIVNDVDRLGRGDSIDQEIIKVTFAAAHCLIITPNKDIDPSNSTDEDMLDFSMFLARFEYKKITQRMATGRLRSAMSGNFVVPRPPYGYRKVTIDGRATLEPDPETAPIAKMIFGWYESGELGYVGIAKRLCQMGIKTYMGVDFTGGTIKRMLTNPVYIGCVTWGATKQVSVIENGKRIKKTTRKHQPKVIENAHPAIIDRVVFDSVQARLSNSNHAAPVNIDHELINPLCGLVKCAVCGRTMKLHHAGSKSNPGRVLYIACGTYGCPTVGIDVRIVVDAVIESMQDWCATYEDVEPEPVPSVDASKVNALRHQLDAIDSRLKRAKELVELEIYSLEEYVQQREELNAARESIIQQIDEAEHPVAKQTVANILPQIHTVLDAYQYASTPRQQNMLLRTVVDKIIYDKTTRAKKGENPAEHLTLTVYPLISGRR